MAIDRLAAITSPTPREAAYISAVTAFYDKAAEPYPERLGAWAAVQQGLARDYPKDIDAGAFAALAMLATAAPGDQSLATQPKAGALLEDLHRQAPDHPGVFHYAIHAYDHPPLAEKATGFAEGYDRMAPEVPHALHMPSHIFVRLGKWPEVEAWNRRSAAAALDQPMAGGVVSGHYAHAQDYFTYALLQMGEARPLPQWLHRHPCAAGLETVLMETRQVKGAPKAMPVRTDRRDTLDIARLIAWAGSARCIVSRSPRRNSGRCSGHAGRR